MDTQKIIKILENIDLVLYKMTPIFKKVTSGFSIVIVFVSVFYIMLTVKKMLDEFLKK